MMFKSLKFITACLIVSIIVGGSELYANAAELVKMPVTVSRNVSCTVDRDGTVTYSAVLGNINVMSDDNLLYLFELQPFEYEITDTTNIITFDFYNVSETIPEFKFPVNFRQENTRLYSKFAIGIKSGDVIYMVTEPTYITNPEALAWNTLMRYPRTKKSTQGEDFINLFLDGKYGPEIGWIFKTIQVLNTGESEALTHPLARADAGSNDTQKIENPMYYMFNASDEEGVRALTKSMEYYVSNSKGGENWIIGNEVNTRAWNYMAWTDWETYIREYTQVFRVMYNAIMSTNANARVYVCIDHMWDKNETPDNEEYYQYMDGKDFLQRFSVLIKQSGDIDWGVAQHPYTNPITYPKFWDMSGCKNGDAYASEVMSGQVVTFQNLSVLTDFMKTAPMLDKNGNVRHIILSEIGVSNSQGSEVQAAALCASYAAAADNPYIDEMMYLNIYSDTETDTTLDAFSQHIYDGMDTENSQLYFEWAKTYIGINDWSEILW